MELTPELIAIEVKNSVAAVNADLKTVQASIDTLALEVKAVANASVAVETKSTTLKAIEAKSTELASFHDGNIARKSTVEFKAAVDMLRANANAGSRTISSDGAFVGLPNRLTHVRDVMNIQTLSTPSYTYDRELAHEGNPGLVAEGGLKPKISFSTVTVVANAAKIASHYKISDELAKDAPALAANFEKRGRELTLQAEDTQLLYGSGANGELQGIMPLAVDFNPGSIRVTNPQNYDVLRVAKAQVRKSMYAANAILMNPSDVAELELTKDEEGRYILPAIFGANASTVSRVTIYEIDAINEGEFLVGAFDMGVDTFQIDPLRVEMTNSNENDFIYNKLAVRIEERLLQAVTRPSAFVTGTFADAKVALAAA